MTSHGWRRAILDQIRKLSQRRRWLAVLVFLCALALLWGVWPTLWHLVQERATFQAYVRRMGWWGPLALVLFNALQIIIAPIPGYVVQLAAGFLYGPIWGGVWASAGLLVGSTVAMGLARTIGRPIVERLFGAARLEKWEKVTFSTNTIVWCVMLLGPTGDFPYYLAGLSRVSYTKILIIITIIRIPSVFVAAAAGAGVIFLAWWQIALIVGLLTAVIVLFFYYQERLLQWTEREIEQRTSL